MIRVLALLMLLLFAAPQLVDAQKRPRHRKAHVVQQAQPEPILSPCRLGTLPAGDTKVLTPAEERVFRPREGELGYQRNPINVDPCAGEPLPQLVEDFVPVIFLKQPIDSIDREAKAFKREDGKFVVLNKGTVNEVWTIEEIADKLKRGEIAVKPRN